MISSTLIAMAFAGPLSALALSPAPTEGRPVLVLAGDAGAVVHAAGGHDVTFVGTRWFRLAQGGPDFVARTHALGAWHVMDGQWLFELCSSAEG